MSPGLAVCVCVALIDDQSGSNIFMLDRDKLRCVKYFRYPNIKNDMYESELFPVKCVINGNEFTM